MFMQITLALTGLFAGVAHAEEDLTFELEGYYRTRGYVFGDLYGGQREAGRYMMQRLRLQPIVKFEDRAKVVMMVDALDDVIGGIPSTPNPGPTPSPSPTPTVPIDQGDCPAGALWLDQPIPGNENGAFGLSSVIFGPNETKYFCSRLPAQAGNAKRFKLGASGLDNDHTCESMRLEVVSIPQESTADLSNLVSGTRGSRNPYVNVAFYFRDADVGMDAPPGLYILKATEMYGDRDPGQQVCRNFQIYKLITYP